MKHNSSSDWIKIAVNCVTEIKINSEFLELHSSSTVTTQEIDQLRKLVNQVYDLKGVFQW